MDNAQVLERLTEIARDVLNNDSLVLKPEMAATDVPDWDSFNHVNIVVATEVRFGIKFKTAELEQLKSIGAFVDLIERKLNHK
jgi:acyl carrier protein